jgi:uncharacterized membrane protein
MPSIVAALLPNPLHPAVVHFPVVFAVLAPVAAIGAVVAIRRGGRPLIAWGLATSVMLALVASSWLALASGQREEDRVERVVAEAPLESHEEAGERFLALSTVLLGLAAAGLLPRRAGAAFRTVATVGTFVILAAGWQVGHSGGALVYEHGAATAYVGNPGDSRALRRAEGDDGN